MPPSEPPRRVVQTFKPDPEIPPTPDEVAAGLHRVSRLTVLPAARAEAVFREALQETTSDSPWEGLSHVERAILRACRRLWDEERQGER